MRSDSAKLKQDRLRQIAAFISKQPVSNISVEKLVAWIEVNIGLTAKKANEYIRTLALAYDWSLDDQWLDIAKSAVKV